MELMGENLVTIAFNHWLKKYNFEARVRGAYEDFFWFHDDTITYSFLIPNEAVDNWYALLEELGCQFDIDLFYTCFLHELGHSHTYHTFEPEEIDEYEATCEEIVENPSSFAEDLHYVYTHLPVEYEAARWAVDYINTYPERIKELVDLVGKAVRLFYKLNTVAEEIEFDFCKKI